MKPNKTDIAAVLCWVPLLISWMRKMLSLFQDAEAVNSLITTKDFMVHWDFVWQIMALSGLIILIMTHLEDIVKWASNRIKYYDLPMVFAVNYFTDCSRFADATHDSKIKIDKTDVFNKSLKKAAEKGVIKVFGVKKGDYKISKIPKSVWKENVSIRIHCEDGKIDEKTHVNLIENQDKNEDYLYFGLFVNDREIRKIWPSKIQYRDMPIKFSLLDSERI